MIRHFGERTLWLYWEGPKPPYIQLCEELLKLHNETAVVLSPESLLNLGFPKHIWEVIQGWHVAQRSDAIRTWLLLTFGGMWSDIDCIPMRSFATFIELAKRCPAGVAVYDSTDRTIGVGFIAARRGAEPIRRLWNHIEAVAVSGKYPSWLEVSTQPFTEIVRDMGREHFLLWPLSHISPVPWYDNDKFLQRKPDHEHEMFARGFPAAWCWMLCNQKLKSSEAVYWTRNELIHGDSLLSYVIRRSLNHVTRSTVPAKGLAVATLNVHNDGLPHNFRKSMQHAAERWGAEFVEIRRPIVPWPDPYWEKLNLDRHLNMYERVVYLDRDVVVRSDCPNLFELVPEETFGLVPSEQEGHNLIDIHIQPAMDPLCRLLSVNMDYSTEYYNSGVMVFSPQLHGQVFQIARDLHAIPWVRNWVTIDQGLLALALKITDTPVTRLPPVFNRCGDKLWNHWQPDMDDYIWHFCGQKNWDKMANTRWHR